MELTASTSKDNELCKLCNEQERRYICPKCNIGYCSIDCYKSTAHLECSETFYKQCFEDELKSQQGDPELKKKTLDILQRVYNYDANDDILNQILHEKEDNEEELDSDDEDIPSLEKRLKSINLDNPNELWSALTATERQEFEALIQSGEALKLLPSWIPWWTFTVKKKIIKDVNESNQDQTYINKCPKILDIATLKIESKVSPFIRFSIINTIYSYAYSVMYLNGEHHSTPLDATYVFLRICETIRINKVFKDTTSAVEDVLLEVTNCDALPADQDTILGTKKAGDAILNGPEEENKCFYMLSALSDLHQIIIEAKKEISVKKTKPSCHEFNSKFPSIIDLGLIEVSKKSFSLILKKIEFFIAWIRLQGPNYDITEGEEM